MHPQKQALINKWATISPSIKQAFSELDREMFIPQPYSKYAYHDEPQPIHDNQTISQPSTVAVMLNALNVKEGMNVLEIGSGSGFTAAMLSKLVGNSGKVTSIEINPKIAAFAKDNMKKAGIKNVEIILQDGSYGHQKNAKYDRIIGISQSPLIPQAWISQLKGNGVILSPIGSETARNMMKVTNMDGRIKTEFISMFGERQSNYSKIIL